jgi:hypothetical protein
MVLLLIAVLSNAIIWHTPTNKTKEEKALSPLMSPFPAS